MSTYLEFHVKGGGCALVEAAMIGAVMAKGTDAWKPGTSETPTLIVLRSGSTLEIIGSSPGGVVGRVVSAKEKERELRQATGAVVYVDWLEPLNQGQRDDDAGG